MSGSTTRIKTSYKNDVPSQGTEEIDPKEDNESVDQAPPNEAEEQQTPPNEAEEKQETTPKPRNVEQILRGAEESTSNITMMTLLECLRQANANCSDQKLTTDKKQVEEYAKVLKTSLDSATTTAADVKGRLQWMDTGHVLEQCFALWELQNHGTVRIESKRKEWGPADFLQPLTGVHKDDNLRNQVRLKFRKWCNTNGLAYYGLAATEDGIKFLRNVVEAHASDLCTRIQAMVVAILALPLPRPYPKCWPWFKFWK